MKKIILIIIVLCLLIPGVLGIVNYSVYNYGVGQYGSNTPPTIITYIPTDLTPNYYIDSTHDFNITFVDYDGDDVYIYWYINQTDNVTNQNLSILFNETGLFNITANLTDTYDNTYTTWITTITLYQLLGNISDVLIIPSVIPSGSLMIIKVNVTSSINYTNISAYLNTNGDFKFLSETPQNQSIQNIWTTNYTEVQWYVATPAEYQRYDFNVSYTLQNTTGLLTETERVLVTRTGDENLVIGLILVWILFIGLYVYMIRFFTIEFFQEHGGFKMLFVLGVFWLMLIPFNISIQYNDYLGGPEGVTNLLEGIYPWIIWINWFITAYCIIWFTIKMLQKVQSSVSK